MAMYASNAGKYYISELLTGLAVVDNKVYDIKTPDHNVRRLFKIFRFFPSQCEQTCEHYSNHFHLGVMGMRHQRHCRGI